MVLALGPQIGEARLLVEAARGVVEELRRDLLALRVLRVALDHPAACLRDQVDGTTKRNAGDAFPSVVAVDEDAGEAVVGKLLHAIRLVVLPVMDVRELVRGAVLTPGNRCVPVEDQRRVRDPLPDEALLPRAALLALGPALARMEPRAPAAAESHAVVLLGEAFECIPRRCVERLDRVRSHAPSFTTPDRPACDLFVRDRAP